MTSATDNGQPSDEIMDDLAHEASTSRPRLFAIYGVLPEIEGMADEEPFLGWGMDLDGGRGTLYWDPDDNSTHHADSAEQVLRFHQGIGTARLDWLNEAPSQGL